MIFEFYNDQNPKMGFLDDETSPKMRKQRRKGSRNIIAWIYNQLCEGNPCVEWVDRLKLRFRINDQNKLASLWGKLKKNNAMDFNKFS